MDTQTHTLPELTITRVFNAPLEKVWRAWTDPKELAKWWGPRGTTAPTCQWEAKKGGTIYIVMLAGEELGPLRGSQWPMSGRVEEVTPPDHLTFTANALVDGRPILEHRTTVTLEPEGQQTRMTLHIQVTMATPEAAGPLQGMEQGWTESIDKLGELVER